MEFKKTLLTLSVIATLSPTVALAEQPNYSYLDGGYVRLDIDDIDLEPTGFFARGSVALNENWFLLGGYFSADDSNGLLDVEADQYNLGGGFRTELNDNTSLHATAEYINADAEAEHRFGQRASAEEDGYGLGVGVRSMVGERFELNADLGYSDSGESDGTDVGVGAAWYLTDNLGLLAEVNFDDDSNRVYLLGGRVSF